MYQRPCRCFVETVNQNVNLFFVCVLSSFVDILELDLLFFSKKKKKKKRKTLSGLKMYITIFCLFIIIFYLLFIIIINFF